MPTHITRLKTGALASVNETIRINDIEMEIEKENFNHQARLEALGLEFRQRRDKLREEHQARLAEITGDA